MDSITYLINMLDTAEGDPAYFSYLVDELAELIS
jgi:hypothetical protein